MLLVSFPAAEAGDWLVAGRPHREESSGLIKGIIWQICNWGNYDGT